MTLRDRGPSPAPDLDLRILDLLSRHRVLTQNQLAAINPKTPARTLRYRCARLAENGLAGRSRPYREMGSAPFHLWPTRKGEAVVKGGPPPRGGDRSEPNPLFLSHAAGLSEIYVALERTLPDQVRIAHFEREGEAREEFTVLASREKRAIAPDLFIEIADEDGNPLSAFVELDLGSMSHRRLAQKAAGYAEYAQAKVWQQRHPFCPALLFITTTESRARSFLAAMRRQVGRESLLLTCACDLARELDRCAVDQRWLLDDEDAGMTDLLGALLEARQPFDEWKEHQAVQRREEEEERKRLRSDPEAFRTHLARRHGDWGLGRLGQPAAAAIEMTLEREEPLASPEREALRALAAMLADPLRLELAESEPGPEARHAFRTLVTHHKKEQLGQIEDLVSRDGNLPLLRQARRAIEGGDLRAAEGARFLAELARERMAKSLQERLRADYGALREQKAERMAKAQGLIGRLRNGPEAFLDKVDQRSLRRCQRCDELAYPDPERARYERGVREDVAGRCHFCGSTDLSEIDRGEASA
jgi:hypothetical protein